jgi:hypothetical protein
VPIPEKRELRRFCEIDGWEETSSHNPDHDYYVRQLESGRLLRTKVSRGRGPVCADPALWHRIWRHQLELDSEDEFWEVLKTRTPAARGKVAEPEPQGPRMPAWLFEFLINVAGQPEPSVLDMNEEQAMRVYLDHIQSDRDA